MKTLLVVTLFTAVAMPLSAGKLHGVGPQRVYATWPVSPVRRGAATVAFLLTGVLLAALYERWALATGRWAYDAHMPVVFGIGASPLAQWVVLPSLELMILTRLLLARQRRVHLALNPI